MCRLLGTKEGARRNVVVRGNWTDQTAGGWLQGQGLFLNPQYRLTVSAATPAYLTMERTDDRFGGVWVVGVDKGAARPRVLVVC